MCTPVILADRCPPSTYDTPTSTCHVIIARAELQDRRHTTADHPATTKDVMPVSYARPIERAALMEGLRALADYLETNPDVPAPSYTDVYTFPPNGDCAEMRRRCQREGPQGSGPESRGDMGATTSVMLTRWSTASPLTAARYCILPRATGPGAGGGCGDDSAPVHRGRAVGLAVGPSDGSALPSLACGQDPGPLQRDANTHFV
jgi:hypothetical protein